MGDYRNIVNMTMLYRDNEDSFYDWLIIGSDYAGNHIGINKDGEVMMYDHDFDELVILAETFEQYILDALDK